MGCGCGCTCAYNIFRCGKPVQQNKIVVTSQERIITWREKVTEELDLKHSQYSNLRNMASSEQDMEDEEAQAQAMRASDVARR